MEVKTLRKVKSASLMISVLMVLSMVSIMAVAPVSAAHTVTVALDPPLSKGDVSEDYTLTVTVEIGSDSVSKVKVEVPVDGEGVPLYDVTAVTIPSGWTYDSTLKEPEHVVVAMTFVAKSGNEILADGFKSFEFTATTPTESGSYTWTVTTTDTEGDSETPTVETGVDAIPPTIVHVPIYEWRLDGPYEIKATIVDAEGNLKGDNLFLHYSVDKGEPWIDVLLESVGEDDNFAGDIPDQDDGIEVWYYITASDTMGNGARDPPLPGNNVFTVDKAPPTFIIKAFGLVGEEEVEGLSSGSTKIVVTSNENLQAAPTVEVTDPEGSVHDVTDPAVVIEENWEWSYLYTVENDCEHTIAATGTDLAGNVGTGTANFDGDVIAPTAITGLSAKAYPFRIDLTWAESSDEKSSVVSYNIYRNIGSPVVVSDNFYVSVETNSYTDRDCVDGETYYYVVTAVDEVGNESVSSNEISATFFWEYPTTHYTVNLWGGWNLVSLPLIPENDAIENVISGVKGSVESVWAYDTETDHWTNYDPNLALSLETMVDGKGYWMYMSEPAILEGEGYEMMPGAQIPPAYNVVSGWNLIGFKSMSESMSASDYLVTIATPQKWTYLRMWHTTLVRFVEIADMTPGYGYWIYMTDEGQIVPPIEVPPSE